MIKKIALIAVTGVLTAARSWAWPVPLPTNQWQLTVTVPVEATVQASPPGITLQAHKVERSYQVFRKEPHDLTWGSQIGTIPAGSGVWTDTNVVVGTEYEYRLYGGTTAGESRSDARLYGYLRSGIAVDQTGWRGRVALVVENRVTNNLATALQQYIEDLTGDGWTVHVINTPRGLGSGGMDGSGSLHVPIRNQIIALDNAYPGQVKHVSLLGNVPEPRTGLSYNGPDGHGNKAAFGADCYYADVDGTWTDTGQNTASGAMANAPGDGKYDQTRTTTSDKNYFELGFGRMDMPFLTEGPLLGLRNYLDKLHRYKHAAPDFRPDRRGLIRGGFDNVAETGWNSMTALLGLDNIEYIPWGITSSGLDYDQMYSAGYGPYLFYCKGNAAPTRGIGGRAVIWTGLQSGWGYWYESSSMADALAEDSFTLSYTWSAWGWRYFYHRLGLGDVMGDMMRISINNRGWYATDGLHRIDSYYWPNGDHTGAMFMNHLGDPLLRLYMFPPARQLAAAPTGSGVRLDWEASEDPAVSGYHVYRSPAMDQPFTRLTTTPVAATTYTDAGVTTGTHIYMVRAVKLDVTASGSFWNGSQGIFRTINLDAAPASLGVATASLSAFFDSDYTADLVAAGGYPSYTWALAGGALPAGVQLETTGQLTGRPVASGDFPITVSVTDASGATATRALTLAVAPERQRIFAPEADAVVNSGTTAINFNYGATRVFSLTSTQQAFMRFRAGLPAGLSTVTRAVLRVYPNESANTDATQSFIVALADDDTWLEGNKNGTAANPADELTHANRPPDSALASPVSRPANPTWGAPFDVDVTSLVNADLAADPSGVFSFRVAISSKTFAFPSRESLMGAYVPQLVLEYAAGPQVALVTPAGGHCRVAPGREAWLAATVTHPSVDPATLTLAWSVARQPAGATVQFSAPTAAQTAVAFDREGTYMLRLTASDGSQSATVDAVVDVSALEMSGVLAPEIAHYTFDEGSGAVARNRAGGPDGTLVNFNLTNAWVSAGKIGGAVNFAADNGTNRAHVVALPHAAYDFALDRPWTVSLWVKLTATGNIDVVGKALATASFAQCQFRIRSERESVAWPVGTAPNVTSYLNYNEHVLNDGQWRMLTLVNDPAQKLAFGFIDGGFGGVRLITKGTETTTADFLIGTVRNTNNADTAGDYEGMIDDVRVYDRALSFAEVRQLYQAEPLNLAPVVVFAPVAGAVNPGGPVTLAATVTDDGRPAGGALTYQWEKASGPGTVVFGSPTAPTSTATFHAAGTYVVRLIADDGDAAAAATLAVQVVSPGSPEANAMPVVNAGTDRNFTAPQTVTLQGSATDDGRPNPPAALTYRWQQLRGPGVVTVGNATQTNTTARLPGYGVYVLELTASDGALTGADTVTLTVAAEPNAAPVVNAGPDREVYAMSNITVVGTATDDGLPNPPGTLSNQWRQIAGPATAVISNTNALTTQVSFPELGEYVLMLRANDGELSAQAMATYTVIRQTEGNTAPVIGLSEINLAGPGTYLLDPPVSDDGLPKPPGSVTTAWELVSGPGQFAGYGDYNGAESLLAFDAPGEYLLRLVADDSLLQTTGMVTAVVADTHRYRNVYAWGRNENYECGPFVISPSTRNTSPPANVGWRWKQVAIGSDSVYALDEAGTVYASGQNTYYELGATTAVPRRHFAAVPGLTNILQIAHHGFGGAALRADGTVWTWGYNYYGQLGSGTSGTGTERATPGIVSGLNGVQAIAAQSYTVLAVRTNGTVWGWGKNGYGQLGNGTTTNASTPVQMIGITTAVKAAVGSDFSVVLLQDGTLRSCGYNAFGRLGDGTTTNASTPVVVVKSTAPDQPLTDVTEISGGGAYTIAADTTGSAWAWGYNQSGRLGIGQSYPHTNLATRVRDDNDPSGYLTGVRKVAASAQRTYAAKTNGTLHGWGWGYYNAWGDPNDTSLRYTAGPVFNLPAVTDVWAGEYSAFAISGLATYETFSYENFTDAERAAGLAAPTYDFDGDGKVNLLEYALRLDPIHPDGFPAVPFRREGNELVFTVDYLAAADLTVSFETSLDLRDWSPAAPTSAAYLNLGDLTRATLRFDIAPNQNRLFLRLKARRVE